MSGLRFHRALAVLLSAALPAQAAFAAGNVEAPAGNAAFERGSVPPDLAGVYRELPGGAMQRIAVDPLARAAQDSGTEIWAIRHGETESNRAKLLAGSGTNAPLTQTLNEQGTSGIAQAQAAAIKMYEAWGGDAWARRVLSGRERPAAILVSPLLRAKQTAAALTQLLDRKAAELSPDRRAPLYQLEEEPGLAEMAYGRLEGIPLAQAKTHPSWPNWDGYAGEGRSFLDRFPEGENRMDVIVRQRQVLERAIARFGGRKIVAFSHFETVTAQKAIFGLLNTSADGALRVTPVENAVPIALTSRPAPPTVPALQAWTGQRESHLVTFDDPGSAQAFDGLMAAWAKDYGFRRNAEFKTMRSEPFNGRALLTVQGWLPKTALPALRAHPLVRDVYPSFGQLKESEHGTYQPPTRDSLFRSVARRLQEFSPMATMPIMMPVQLLVLVAMIGPFFVASGLAHPLFDVIVAGALLNFIQLGGIGALFDKTPRTRAALMTAPLAFGGILLAAHALWLFGTLSTLNSALGYKAFLSFFASKSPNVHETDKAVNSMEAALVFDLAGFSLMALGWAITSPHLSLGIMGAAFVLLSSLIVKRSFRSRADNYAYPPPSRANNMDAIGRAWIAGVRARRSARLALALGGATTAAAILILAGLLPATAPLRHAVGITGFAAFAYAAVMKLRAGSLKKRAFSHLLAMSDEERAAFLAKPIQEIAKNAGLQTKIGFAQELSPIAGRVFERLRSYSAADSKLDAQLRSDREKALTEAESMLGELAAGGLDGWTLPSAAYRILAVSSEPLQAYSDYLKADATLNRADRNKAEADLTALRSALNHVSPK